MSTTSSDERTAIITGGTGNLGSTVTRTFLSEGYRVLVPWRNADGWNELEEDLEDPERDRTLPIRADLTDEKQVTKMVDEACSEWGRIDCLLNLAGAAAFGEKIWETELETWHKMLSVNLTTAFLCCKHVLPQMREQGSGRIVNVSSKASRDIQPGAAAYAVAKGGVTTLTRAIREELKDTDITANVIVPSVIDTPVTREFVSAGNPDRWVSPRQIADLLLALCGDRCRAVSGSELKLYGEL